MVHDTGLEGVSRRLWWSVHSIFNQPPLQRNLGALLGVIIALLSIATIVSRGEDIYQIVRALAKMGFRAVCDRCTL